MLSNHRLWMFAAVTAMVAIGFGSSVWADIPGKLNYQLRLTDLVGDPLPGTHSMVYSIYDADAGGNQLWSEAKEDVADANGVISTTLGSENPIAIPFDDSCWLEVEVDGEILLPRREIVSSAYAFHAQNTDELAGLPADQYSLVGHAHDDDYVNEGQENSVTSVMVVPDIVSSLDGVANDAGDIDLVPGTGISITPDDANDVITISATGGGGDITGVEAGDGLTDGGDTGDVTLNVGVGTGLQVSADAVSFDAGWGDNEYVNEEQGNSITSQMIVDGAVTQADIATNGVDAAEIAPDAVGSSEIAPNAVGQQEISTGGVASSEILDGSIVSADISDNSITAADIGANAITTSEIADRTIASIDIAQNAVGQAEIASGGVASSEILNSSIVSADIANNTITADDIGANAVTSSEIAANAVGQSEIATNGVASVEIQDNSITAADIGANAVGSSEIAAGAVGTGDIAGNAVTSARQAGTSLAADIDSNIMTDMPNMSLTFTPANDCQLLIDVFVAQVSGESDPHRIAFILYKDATELATTRLISVGGSGSGASMNRIVSAAGGVQTTIKVKWAEYDSGRAYIPGPSHGYNRALTVIELKR